MRSIQRQAASVIDAPTPRKRHMTLLIKALAYMLQHNSKLPAPQKILAVPMLNKMEQSIRQLPEETLTLWGKSLERMLLAVQQEDLSDEDFLEIVSQEIETFTGQATH